MQIDAMAFGPHPDDAELACGGLLLKFKDWGYSTSIVDLTEAELSTNGDISIRRQETEQSTKILMLDFRTNLGLGDCRITNSYENRLKVINIVRQHRPRLVLIPYSKDRHPDHENSHKLLKDALFISGLEKFESGKSPYRPPVILCYMLNYQFEPSFIVDISAYYTKKMDACMAYKSQFYSTEENSKSTFINSKYFREMITGRDKCYGMKIRAGYGEPYLIEDDIRIEDPLSFFDYLCSK